MAIFCSDSGDSVSEILTAAGAGDVSYRFEPDYTAEQILLMKEAQEREESVVDDSRNANDIRSPLVVYLGRAPSCGAFQDWSAIEIIALQKPEIVNNDC